MITIASLSLLLGIRSIRAEAYAILPQVLSSNVCHHYYQHHVQPNSRTSLHGIRCEDMFYQLEEREDAESSSTEVYLMKDRQVDFGQTDGPVPDTVEGTWHVEPGTDDFKMTIHRVFGSGKRGSDMGEFQFDIVRELRGEMTMVGESVAITGVIVNMDDLIGDKEVGYFNMVDDTDERESYALEGRFKFEIDKTKGLRLSESMLETSSLRGMFANADWNSLGPGGLDPNEVISVLPPDMANAFRNQNFEMLEAYLKEVPKEEADYYIDGCINAGLWLAEEQVAESSKGLGPGDLDPMEVWQSLPPLMQQAFECQDMTMLENALSNMNKEEADYHLKRCEDAGLWG